MDKELTTCIVDADNEFVFGGMLFKISNKNKNYKVLNSYKDNKEYTNSAEMVSVKVGINKEDCKLFFLNEDGKIINDVYFVNMVGV